MTNNSNALLIFTSNNILVAYAIKIIEAYIVFEKKNIR